MHHIITSTKRLRVKRIITYYTKRGIRTLIYENMQNERVEIPFRDVLGIVMWDKTTNSVLQTT